ncbi:NupC/NupG family nucleoside CNT transporter [Ornithinimicrobium sp. Arc0846-15]|nr:NupC/NupG family nucleoside CNT transporter [Ornithinimicrobium laminariae]
MDVLWGLAGMAVLLGLAFALSTNRKAIRLRTVGAALALQLLFGVIVLYWSAGQRGLEYAANGVQAIINSSNAGIGFLFGPVIPEEGLIFAFQVLPVIIFFASLTAVLYHWGFLQKFVAILGGAIQKVLGTGKAESVNAAANIFVGQTEAPLIIKPYIKGLTRSALFAVMVGGLSTVAGSVLVGYSLLGAPLEYLIAASFMAAPGALLMAKMIVPEDDPDAAEAESSVVSDGARRKEEAKTARSQATVRERVVQRLVPDTKIDDDEDKDEAGGESEYRNVIDAAAGGAGEGLKLALNIGAMLLAFISLIALVNLILGVVGGWFGIDALTFEQILGYVFAPLMFVIGVPWNEAVQAGGFVGQKIVVNEFVAFADFGPIADTFSTKTSAIITFALTGFANLGSLGILLGGLGGIAPERRSDIAELGLRAIAAATLANLMSAAIAGILIN